MSTLSLKNINKIYSNNVQAVFDFNIDIADKEFIVFVGPSGCGKSTTLRMVAGLEDITSGELFIDGKLVNSIEPKDRDIAMVFQSYALYPHMTVYENMSFALKLKKMPMPLFEENEKVNRIMDENKIIWKEIRALNSKFKRNQNKVELLEPRAELYAKIYSNQKLISNLQKPIFGRDEYKISRIKKTLNSLQRQIEKMKSDSLGKYANNAEKLSVLATGIKERENEACSLNKELQFYENNDTPLTKLRHLTKKEIDIEVNKVAESIDLVKYLYRKPAALSGGQRQRVALGRAIVRKPKVFLMDEPLSNLDAKLRVQTRSEISKIHERVGATTIYVTHDQTEAMTMADRIVVMKDGYIQQIGTPDEIYDNPMNKFVGGFIGNPAMNFLVGTYSKGVFKVKEHENVDDNSEFILGLEKLNIKIPIKYQTKLNAFEGKDIILGIRPEAIYIEDDKNNTKPMETIKCECDYSETLGYELIIYTYICGQKLVLKVSNKNKIKSGDMFSFSLNEDSLYFFDGETEERIK